MATFNNQRVGDLLNMWICPGVISSAFFHVDYGGMILPRWKFYSVKNEDTAPAVMNLWEKQISRALEVAGLQVTYSF